MPAPPPESDPAIVITRSGVCPGGVSGRKFIAHLPTPALPGQVHTVDGTPSRTCSSRPLSALGVRSRVDVVQRTAASVRLEE